MRSSLLSPEERYRVSAAIRAAEETTSGEIFCVLARTSDDYFFPAAFMLMAGLGAASLVAAFVLDWLWFDVGAFDFVAAQAVALAAALLVLWSAPPLRIRLVPRRLAYRRAHENAARQFLAHNVHVTSGRTGVLVFVSLAEHYAEVVADAGIAARVPQPVWNGVVAALVEQARKGQLAEGFAEAVGSVGRLLAEHFPVRDGEPNEVDDHLVEL